MAKEVFYRVIDDLDGTRLNEGEGEAVKFTYQGTAYEMDLSPENARAFHEAIGRFAKVARKSTARTGRTAAAPTQADKEHLAKVRAWAAENGHEVNQRGRIPKQIFEAYSAAHGGAS